MKKRVGIVGCGSIAKMHTKNLRSMNVPLAFYSRRKESAEKLCGGESSDKVFDSYESMLADTSIAAVVICSPPAEHVKQTIDALKAGKLVLTEKPLCLTAEETDLIAKADASVGGALMVAENYYYKPSLKKLKKWLTDGIIGEVESISVKKVLKETASGWKKECGALIEGGIHFVALLTELAGSEAKRVKATFPGFKEGTPEQHSILEIDFENGVRGKLEFSCSTPSLTKGVFQHSVIQGKKGKIVFESNGLYAFIKSDSASRVVPFPLGDLLGYRKMSEDFVKWVNNPTEKPFAVLSRVEPDLKIIWESYKQLP